MVLTKTESWFTTVLPLTRTTLYGNALVVVHAQLAYSVTQTVNVSSEGVSKASRFLSTSNFCAAATARSVLKMNVYAICIATDPAARLASKRDCDRVERENDRTVVVAVDCVRLICEEDDGRHSDYRSLKATYISRVKSRRRGGKKDYQPPRVAFFVWQRPVFRCRLLLPLFLMSATQQSIFPTGTPC